MSAIYLQLPECEQMDEMLENKSMLVLKVQERQDISWGRGKEEKEQVSRQYSWTRMDLNWTLYCNVTWVGDNPYSPGLDGLYWD